jgi:hypothetical protein
MRLLATAEPLLVELSEPLEVELPEPLEPELSEPLELPLWLLLRWRLGGSSRLCGQGITNSDNGLYTSLTPSISLSEAGNFSDWRSEI